MHRLSCLVVIGSLAAVVSVVAASPAAAAKGGNNDTAKLCQSGWKALVSQTGDPFANQGDCVKDGAQGLSVVASSEGVTACAMIGGLFSGAREQGILWECTYNSPPNVEAPPELGDACVADSDGKGILIVQALGGVALRGTCHATR
jgi:hypothetical protein